MLRFRRKSMGIRTACRTIPPPFGHLPLHKGGFGPCVYPTAKSNKHLDKFQFIEMFKTTHNLIVIPSQCAHWRGNLLRHSGFLRLPHQCAHWFAMTTKRSNSSINWNLKSSNVTERGSDGSAAGGRASDLSDWQRSIADAAACRQGRYRAPQQDREVTIINALCTYCQRRLAASINWNLNVMGKFHH